jgi:hypothetical protein
MDHSRTRSSNGGKIIVLAATLSVFGLALSGLAILTPAAAKQCVSNQSGFRLIVEWHHNTTVVYRKDTHVAYLRPDAFPIQLDILKTKQETCLKESIAEGTPHVVVLSADTANWDKRKVRISDDTIAATQAAIACGGSARFWCLENDKAARGVITYAGEFIQDAIELKSIEGVFAVEIPSTTHWLVVLGTIMSPRTRLGEEF